MKSEMKELYKKCAARIRECIAPKEVAYSFSKAEAILNDYFPDTGHSCLRESSDALPYIKIGEMGRVLLSVIIPTYNNASYVT